MMIKIDAFIREEKFEDVKAGIKCSRCKRNDCFAGYGLRYSARL